MVDHDEYVELMIRAGRVPYKCKFDGNDYGEEDSKDKNGPRVRAPKVECNAWSSKSRMGEKDGYHLPVFDVDMEPDSKAPWSMHDESVRYHVDMMFDEVPVTWVGSTTPGHYHVYMEYPILWDSYISRLERLSRFGIVEHGYVKASRSRGATFVRMEHVRKEMSSG